MPGMYPIVGLKTQRIIRQRTTVYSTQRTLTSMLFNKILPNFFLSSTLNKIRNKTKINRAEDLKPTKHLEIYCSKLSSLRQIFKKLHKSLKRIKEHNTFMCCFFSTEFYIALGKNWLSSCLCFGCCHFALDVVKQHQLQPFLSCQ
jgi:hypothetical protein